MRTTVFLVLLLATACSSSKKSTEEVAAVVVEPATVSVEPIPPSDEQEALWKEYDANALPDLEKRIDPIEFDAYVCDFDLLLKSLEEESPIISIPTSMGMFTFKLQDSGTMSPALAEKFPNIKSFKGSSTDGNLLIRLDTNDEGLFVEITGPEKKDLISPLLKGDKYYYALYKEDALQTKGTQRDETYD